jgi:uncharacterized protein YndB with AHSA1/START domain
LSIRNKKMATKITVSVMVNSSIKNVWDSFTNPEHIINWNFADPSWKCPSAENDLTVGGKYNARMEAKDGSAGFDFWAIYDKVINQKELSYTMGDGRQATTIFENNVDATNVTTTFEAETENSVALQKAGWQIILNNFKNYTENEKFN